MAQHLKNKLPNISDVSGHVTVEISPDPNLYHQTHYRQKSDNDTLLPERSKGLTK